MHQRACPDRHVQAHHRQQSRRWLAQVEERTLAAHTAPRSRYGLTGQGIQNARERDNALSAKDPPITISAGPAPELEYVTSTDGTKIAYSSVLCPVGRRIGERFHPVQFRPPRSWPERRYISLRRHTRSRR